jgi:3-hydroxy-9,10-secoandrosta-1,3,5(10)-triene-9,17-dione monooxygenase
MLSFADMATCVVPGQEANPSPLYKLPYGSVFTFGITTPIIGMATGAYEAHVDYQRDRVRTAAGGQKAKEDPHSQIRIARAAADIDAAWLSLERNITDMQRSAAQGQPISLNLRLRARRDQVLGTERAIAAVDLLFENSGGRALKSGTPLQRFWRDAHAGRVHAMNDVERVLTIVGAGEFGIEPGPGSIL